MVDVKCSCYDENDTVAMKESNPLFQETEEKRYIKNKEERFEVDRL